MCTEASILEDAISMGIRPAVYLYLSAPGRVRYGNGSSLKIPYTAEGIQDTWNQNQKYALGSA